MWLAVVVEGKGGGFVRCIWFGSRCCGLGLARVWSAVTDCVGMLCRVTLRDGCEKGSGNRGDIRLLMSPLNRAVVCVLWSGAKKQGMMLGLCVDVQMCGVMYVLRSLQHGQRGMK